MLQKLKRTLNIGQSKNNDKKAELNLYRNTRDISGKYRMKFLKPSIVKDKIVFKLLQHSLDDAEFYNNYTKMISNLIFSFDIITIFSNKDNNYINNLKSRFVNSQKNNDKLEQYKNIVNELENMGSNATSECYILVEKKFKEEAISFLNKYGFSIQYVGEAEIILEQNTFTEEEYREQVALYYSMNELFEDYEMEE